MIRVQIYLDEADDRWLEEQATALGTSKAALVRQGVRSLRTKDGSPADEPLLRLIGHIRDEEGRDDLSAEHDRYLVDWELGRNRASS